MWLKQRKKWYRDEIWWDRSAVKSTWCSCRAPACISQYSELMPVCKSSSRGWLTAKQSYAKIKEVNISYKERNSREESMGGRRIMRRQIIQKLASLNKGVCCMSDETEDFKKWCDGLLLLLLLCVCMCARAQTWVLNKEVPFSWFRLSNGYNKIMTSFGIIILQFHPFIQNF